MNRLNKTESAIFSICRFSLFLKDPFSQIIFRGRNSCRCVMWSPVHRYSVDIFFSYSGLTVILGSDEKKNAAQASARGVRMVAHSISSY